MGQGATSRGTSGAARVGLALATAALCACAAQPVATQTSASAPTAVVVPPDVAAALIPAPAAKKAEARFDINVHEAPVRGLLMSLVSDTPYNMVVQADVEGEVTLDLKNVTVPEVMQALQMAYGYEYKVSGNSFVVLGARPQTRVFHVNYLNLRRQGRSSTRVSSGQLTDTRGAEGGDSGFAAPADGPRNTVAASGIETQTSSDVWDELERTLKLLVPQEEGRTLVVNRESGLVVARALPAELRLLGEYLGSLQDNLGRQVILEAKILEVTLNDGFQAGINWSIIGKGAEITGVVGGQGVFESGSSDFAGAPINFGPTGVSIDPFSASGIGGAFVSAFDAGDFSAVIELLRSQGEVQVLSSPRVATVNNQKAIIKVGTDEFFVTDINSNTTTGASTNTSQDVELTPFFSGISLDVTPQIDAQNNVILHVHPIVSEVRDQTKTIIVQNTQQTLPLALSNVRETDSIVRARSGQVVVIGGLMQQADRDEEFGLPFLEDIPLLGSLFKQQRKSTRKSELVILLRPSATDLGASPSWEPRDYLSAPPQPVLPTLKR